MKIDLFIKIRLSTFENIGSGPIHLLEIELHTNSMWIVFNEEIINNLTEHDLEQILLGFSHLLKSVAPVFVMCSPQDLHIVPQVKANHTEKPTIFIYDRYPGGIGLSETIYKQMDIIIEETIHWVSRCQCKNGCPSCVGANIDKKMVQQFLHFFNKK